MNYKNKNRVHITGIAQNFVVQTDNYPMPLHWVDIRQLESIFISNRLANRYDIDICQICQSYMAFNKCWGNC